MRIAFAVALFTVSVCTAAGMRADTPDVKTWSPKAAAAYLDGRAAWWVTWPSAARDHETFCVSCHTAVPYALARPALRAPLGERERTPTELKLLDNVGRRVALWKDVAPFYPDQTRGLPKSSESRGTEAVLNALILASRDAQNGRLADETRAAFANMWALQMKTADLSGAWAWLNFKYEPWESPDAPFFGASLAALAVGTAPEGYASDPALRDNLKLLADYLQRQRERQGLFNQVMALWAATKVSGLLPADARQAIVDAALRQQQEDGGWSTASLGSWKRLDGSALDLRSDGYATGLIVLVLRQAGMTASEPHVARGLDWLRRNQDPVSGQWHAASLNKDRDPASDAGRFMSDAATAYAVLALTTH